ATANRRQRQASSVSTSRARQPRGSIRGRWNDQPVPRYQRQRWKGWSPGSRADLRGFYDADGNWRPPRTPPTLTPEPTPRKRKEPGIRPEQARELAKLQRAAGVPWNGNGMRAAEAAREIARLRRLLARD